MDSNEDYYNQYGGTKTDVKTLPTGVEFYVCNGHWDGKIEELDGVRYITCSGEPIVNLDKCNMYILYIDLQ